MMNAALYIPTLSKGSFDSYGEDFGMPVHVIDGKDRWDNYSEMVNWCVDDCDAETFIYHSDRVRTNKKELSRMLSLINSGYGFVSFYRFAFFGMPKVIAECVGGFNEDYPQGGTERDYLLRLRAANVASYISEEAFYRHGPSRWSYKPEAERSVITKGIKKSATGLCRPFSDSKFICEAYGRPRDLERWQ